MKKHKQIRVIVIFNCAKIHIYKNSEGLYLMMTKNNDHVRDMTGIWHAKGPR